MKAINWTARTERKIVEERDDGRENATQGGEKGGRRDKGGRKGSVEKRKSKGL